jgi:ABC-2 type transport system permease protein
MSIPTISTPHAPGPDPASAADPEAQPTIGFPNIVRSEWTKLRSVRSTFWTAGAAFLATVVLSVLTCWRYSYLLGHGQDGGGFEPTELSLNGIYLAQVAAGALGVLTISSEYGTGLIRATLSAVPQRRALLAAKGFVFALATLLVGEILSFLAYGCGQAILSTAHAGSSLSQPGVLRAVTGAGLYLTAIGMLGFGLGAAIRHTAGALSAFFGVLFAPTAIVEILPASWHDTVQKYLPANAGSQIFTMHHSPRALEPWTGLGVFCLYALVAVIAATVLISRRDA